LTAPSTPSADLGSDVRIPRSDDLVLARTHLRLGSLGLARTELEALAGRGTLDDEGIRDLAEARWRTGDIGGAGEAAGAWLKGHPDDILGLVIAAESQAALGRPAEARRLAGRAIERADGSLDPVFAGMQRSPIWPVEPGSEVGPVGVLFDDLHPGPQPLAHAPARPGRAADTSPGTPPHLPLDPGVPEAFGGPSLWGDDADGSDASLGDALDPTTVFHHGRLALEEGRTAEAATGFILSMRSTPGLAPAILDLLAGRGEPILVLVRGDAQRIVGHEIEAMRDHAAAADAIGEGTPGDADQPADARAPADADQLVEADQLADANPPADSGPTDHQNPNPDQETP
jgi:hypothetical protein